MIAHELTSWEARDGRTTARARSGDAEPALARQQHAMAANLARGSAKVRAKRASGAVSRSRTQHLTERLHAASLRTCRRTPARPPVEPAKARGKPRISPQLLQHEDEHADTFATGLSGGCNHSSRLLLSPNVGQCLPGTDAQLQDLLGSSSRHVPEPHALTEGERHTLGKCWLGEKESLHLMMLHRSAYESSGPCQLAAARHDVTH